MEGFSDDESWIGWFCTLEGNDLFCEIAKSYIEEPFNMLGLNTEVTYFKSARNVILDKDPELEPDGTQFQLERVGESAEILYGLIHSRYILTNEGIKKMAKKYFDGKFENCPRYYCENQSMLPIGLSDKLGESMVKLYCPKCNDVYKPKLSSYFHIDGAFFGTNFPHMFFMRHPELRPEKSTDEYIPRLHGFKIHSSAQQLQ